MITYVYSISDRQWMTTKDWLMSAEKWSTWRTHFSGPLCPLRIARTVSKPGPPRWDTQLFTNKMTWTHDSKFNWWLSDPLNYYNELYWKKAKLWSYFYPWLLQRWMHCEEYIICIYIYTWTLLLLFQLLFIVGSSVGVMLGYQVHMWPWKNNSFL